MSDDSLKRSTELLTPTHFLSKGDENSSTPSPKNSLLEPSSNRATPAVIGPLNPSLPNFKNNKKGNFVLQKWVNSEINEKQNQENMNLVKVEVECAKYKIAAEDANTELVELRKLFQENEINTVRLKNSLNDERARHAGTADQARALTHVAAQLRAKSEKLENTVMKQNETIKIFQKSSSDTAEKLKLQDARVDALARICSALENQLRDAAINGGAVSETVDIATIWRQQAYKTMVQLNHTENRLTQENSRLRRVITRHGKSDVLPPSQKTLHE